MRILRTWLLASAVGIGSCLSAAAQGTTAPPPSAEALAAAKELVTLLSGDMIGNLTRSMVAQAWPKFEQSLRARYPQLDAATGAELRTEFEKQMAENVAESLNDAPAIYARHLTVAEMRDIQAFYRTPTGAKTLTLMPQIASEVMGSFFPRIESMMQRVEAAMTGILQKHGYAPK
jgi:uncharacterized protein